METLGVTRWRHRASLVSPVGLEQPCLAVPTAEPWQTLVLIDFRAFCAIHQGSIPINPVGLFQ